MGRDEEDRAKGECSQQVCGGNGMDELLEALGYKVRSSDMADVAQKLEQLEKVMVSTPQENGICHLATDTVHYDPADLHGWVHSMLNEIGNNDKNDAVQSRVYNDDSDLRIIPGIASFPPPRNEEENADQIQNAPPLRNSPIGSELDVNSDTESRVPVVLVQETTGVRLVQALMACAEAIQQGDLNLAEAFVNQIGLLAAAQGGAMGKVAYYFAQALTRRIYGLSPVETLDTSSSFSDMLHVNFYESCPYLKFAHFTANQAILEAFAAVTTVHIIDFGLNQGLQWPALMQALALRPGGPPSFRLTGIGPPLPDNTDYLQQVGWKLAQLAESIGVPFEFRGFACNSIADLDPFVLEIRPGESVAVNCVFELHRLLARSGTLEKVLDTIRGINPEIVTVVEQEANHNGPVFLDRFTEALHYYSSLFDSLAGSFSGQSENAALMSEVYLGRQICDVVAREGEERVERHETLSQWRVRMGSAGFEPVRLGSNAFRQARMLLALFTGGDGYRVEENNGCLMLGWHTRPLIATSAWRVAATTTELDELTRLI